MHMNQKGEKTMEWLKEILNGLENAEELERKIMEGIGKNFVARADFNQLNSTKKGMEQELLQARETAEREQEWKMRLEELEKRVYMENEERAKQETETMQAQALTARFQAATGEREWRDALTEKAVEQEFKAALAQGEARGMTDAEILEELVRDKNYFVNPNKPAAMTGMGRVSMSKVQENKMRALMGLSTKN